MRVTDLRSGEPRGRARGIPRASVPSWGLGGLSPTLQQVDSEALCLVTAPSALAVLPL